MAESPRRPLKLVVTLRSANAGGYHAILALGSDGCDPSFRALDASDLPTVLAEVPALLAAAYERWRAEPPNTATRPAKAQSRNASEAPQVSAASAPVASDETPRPPDVAPASTSAKSSSGQLSLFG